MSVYIHLKVHCVRCYIQQCTYCTDGYSQTLDEYHAEMLKVIMHYLALNIIEHLRKAN